MHLTLNIGLDTNTGGFLSARFVLGTMHAYGFDAGAFAVHQSNTERTLVVDVQTVGDRSLPRRVHELAEYLQQDCIAVHHEASGGALYGPKPWGEFNPAFFLTLDGERLADVEVTA